MGGGEEDEMVDEGEGPPTTAAAVNGALGVGTGVRGGGVRGGGGAEIQLGVAIEPLAQILASLAHLAALSQASSSTALTKLPAQAAPAASPVSTKILARRIIRNAFNFLASFAGSTRAGSEGQEVVPLKAFQDWWVKFERRVENDPGFLEREGEDG